MASDSSPRHGSATISLVLGGARSGKSRFAEDLLAAYAGRRIYLATAEPGDEEMRARIVEHRQRRGQG
jgi:adenosyl cobinamide kinase/adenosyl cobinamide phosphate guanylyltransferase